MQKTSLKSRKLLWLFLPVLATIFTCTSLSQKKTTILVITGGHDYDTASFFSIFEDLETFSFDTLSQPFANQFIEQGSAGKYDVLVFYDSWQEIHEKQKSAYLELTKRGTGFLFLHHSLVSYQDWPEFHDLVGGLYHKSQPYDSVADSRYRHDIEIPVHIENPIHPVTSGMADFTIHDEGYSNIRLKDGIVPLLGTQHPDCSPCIAWENKYNKSKIIYLMGGHDHLAYVNPSYRSLVYNSIRYLSED